MTGTPSSDPTPVLQALGNRYHALFRRAGRPDLAGTLERVAQQWNSAGLTIVVCGEVKRGKSSLINALLGRPDLLPVDADIATTAQIVVRHAAQTEVVVTRWTEDGELVTNAIEEYEIEEYGSVLGDRREGVTRISVGLDHPLLAAGLTLVDTPGIGGLDAGHRALALAMIEQADVVVFVGAADEPALHSELQFLDQAATTISTSPNSGAMLTVLNRGDAIADPQAAGDQFLLRARQFAQHHDVLRDQLADHRPIIVVSARLAVRAARARADGLTELSNRLHAESGLDALTTALERVASQPARYRAGSLARLLAGLARVARADLQQRALDATTEGHGERLRELQRESDELASVSGRCRNIIAVECQRLQATGTRRLSAELTSVESRLRGELTTAALHDVLPRLPAQIEAALQAAWLRAAGEVATGMGEVERRLAGLGATTDNGDRWFDEAPPELKPIDAPERTGAKFDVVDHGLPTATSTMFMSSFAAAFLGPVGFVIGAATGGALLLARLTKQAKRDTSQATLQAVSQALREARQDLTAELNLRVLEARQRTETLVDQVVQERRDALGQRRVDLERAQRQAATERAGERAAITRLISVLDTLDAEREAVVSRIDPTGPRVLP